MTNNFKIGDKVLIITDIKSGAISHQVICKKNTRGVVCEVNKTDSDHIYLEVEATGVDGTDNVFTCELNEVELIK